MKFTLGNVNLFLDEKPLIENKDIKYLNLISNNLFTLTSITNIVDEIEAGFVISNLENYCLNLSGENLIIGCGKKCILIGQFLNNLNLSQFNYIHDKATDLYKDDILYFVNNEKIHFNLNYKNVYAHFKFANLFLTK